MKRKTKETCLVSWFMVSLLYCAGITTIEAVLNNSVGHYFQCWLQFVLAGSTLGFGVILLYTLFDRNKHE